MNANQELLQKLRRQPLPQVSATDARSLRNGHREPVIIISP